MLQNKYVIRISSIGLFLTILGCVLFYRYFTINNIVLAEAIKGNIKISNTYITQVLRQHIKEIDQVEDFSFDDAIKSRSFLDFAQESISYFNNFDIAKVIIYDHKGDALLSNNAIDISVNEASNIFYYIKHYLDDYFLNNTSDVEAMEQIYKGHTSHYMIDSALLRTDSYVNTDDYLYDSKKEHFLIVSVMPIMSVVNQNTKVQNTKVIGAIKIFTDVTNYVDDIKYFEYKVLQVSCLIFVVVFCIVLYNTHSAQLIIDRQVATNRALEEAKLKAEHENIAKTEFLANVSHELRTPLNAIIGFSEIILSESYGKLEHKQYLEYINDINNSGKHLLSVINDILDFSKAAADKLKVDNIEIDVNKIASSSIRFVKPRADSSKVNLVEKFPKGHVTIFADPKRLKQSLLNLLSNAVKFTPENGSVTLEIAKSSDNQNVYISVIDTGIGIAEKDIPKALSVFGQVDNKLSRKYEGTGLGLPLTKRLVELMGGTMDITSKIGSGTMVRLTFKLHEDLGE
jgi:two-component system cell cycle sensor histidine kinase PleC